MCSLLSAGRGHGGMLSGGVGRERSTGAATGGTGARAATAGSRAETAGAPTVRGASGQVAVLADRGRSPGR
ncbi:hypothetical protein GCM10017559_42230 [Streptosporangium longisporum]|uniref:Uncharacterized protein n=1 Tax=Streptosporangium longisporum TaxID=46187 RepID=A0ABN3Y8B0_9ACTN